MDTGSGASPSRRSEGQTKEIRGNRKQEDLIRLSKDREQRNEQTHQLNLIDTPVTVGFFIRSVYAAQSRSVVLKAPLLVVDFASQGVEAQTWPTPTLPSHPVEKHYRRHQ